MYIKKVTKKNKRSKKQYQYLHLVENVRTANGPRQRLVLNLGKLDLPKEQYKEMANCIEAMLTGQKQLFSADRRIEKQAQKAVRKILEKRSREKALETYDDPPAQDRADYKWVDVASLEANTARSLGAEYVCHRMWRELKLDKVLLADGIARQNLPLLEALVLGRLVDPGSERHTWDWAENRSAIFELTGRPERYSLSSFYRAGDSLFECKDAIEAHLAAREKELFALKERICFFDLTNTFLEGQALANAKAKRGKSKEKRSDCKLLTLALVVDENGFAKYSHLYPGNQNEGKTLPQMMEALVKLRPGQWKPKTVIMDAGIATKENVQYLKSNGFHYIVVNRGKADFTVADTEKMRVIVDRHTPAFKVEVTRRKSAHEALLMCRSTGRKEKDRGIRTRQESLFVERLSYYHDGLSIKGHTKNYIKVIEMIGRLREKYPGASKLYDVEVIPETDGVNKNTRARKIVWTKRAIYDAQVKFDGCYVLRTDLVDMSDGQIWKTYVMLSRVERAFRCLKSALGLRPIFHQAQQRADAHMFISVLAYHILHAIEYRLRSKGDHRSWNTIRQVLSTHQRLSIAYNVKEQEKTTRNHLRLCSTPEVEHKVIYHRLGLSPVPLSRKYTAVK